MSVVLDAAETVVYYKLKVLYYDYKVCLNRWLSTHRNLLNQPSPQKSYLRDSLINTHQDRLIRHSPQKNYLRVMNAWVSYCWCCPDDSDHRYPIHQPWNASPSPSLYPYPYRLCQSVSR